MTRDRFFKHCSGSDSQEELENEEIPKLIYRNVLGGPVTDCIPSAASVCSIPGQGTRDSACCNQDPV